MKRKPTKPEKPDRADKATRFSASRQPTKRTTTPAVQVAPNARGSHNLTPSARNLIEEVRAGIRTGSVLYLEKIHNIAIGAAIGEDKEKGITGERPDIRLQFEASKLLLSYTIGQPVQPIAAEAKESMSLEQIAEVFRAAGVKADHLLPKPREVVDEPKK